MRQTQSHMRFEIMINPSLSIDYPNFLNYMIEACSRAEVGFFFEEGGCVGMAIALHETLCVQGFKPTYVLFKKTDHVAVRIGEQVFDHQGPHADSCNTVDITGPEILALGHAWHSDVFADKALALDIIEVAQDLAHSQAFNPL